MPDPVWVFSDSDLCALLLTVADSWIGTPWRPYSKAKGPAGGIDCVGLVEEIMLEVGAAPEFTFPRTSADYDYGSPVQDPGDASGTDDIGLEGKVLDYIRGNAKFETGDDVPASVTLGAMCVELELPDLSGDAEVPADLFMPGDIIIMRKGGLFHIGIVLDTDRHFLSCLPRLRTKRTTLQQSIFKDHIVAAFRLQVV